LEIFIRESKLEDFFNQNGETVFVSTFHKVKGKEFDNVFLLLEDFNIATDEAKRHLYVAMTRAKQNLTIHLNTNILDNILIENLERIEDREVYLPPSIIVMQLTYKDIWLDYFINRQQVVSLLTSGELLILNGDECLNSKGQSILKFSKQFIIQIQSMKLKNYELKGVKVNFIVYWLKEGAEREVKIVLPELSFERNDSE